MYIFLHKYNKFQKTKNINVFEIFPQSNIHQKTNMQINFDESSYNKNETIYHKNFDKNLYSEIIPLQWIKKEINYRKLNMFNKIKNIGKKINENDYNNDLFYYFLLIA